MDMMSDWILNCLTVIGVIIIALGFGMLVDGMFKEEKVDE